MSPSITPNKNYQYLVDPDEVREALQSFANQPVIGLDTETFWEPLTRQNRLSLLQIAAPTGEVLVIDALAAGVEQARAIIEQPELMMAAHNARFDDGVLRGAGFNVAGMVDTLRLARRTLNLRSFSLTSVSEHLFGLPLDKTQQRSDWSRRPLSRIQLDYAALDAEIALRVYQELAARLEREGRLASELQGARILPPIEEEAGTVAPRAKAIKKPTIELRPLTSEEKARVEALKRWRRGAADRERIPAYMICPDKTLEHLVIVRPTGLDELALIFGLGPSKITKYGAELLLLLQ